MFSMSKIAGLCAIALTTTACVSSNNASQNAVIETPRAIYSTTQTDGVSDGQLNFFAQDQVASTNVVTRIPSAYEVVDVVVAVPSYLVVSEADVYVPKADIVWREDALGDRHEQVRTIMTDALVKGTSALIGPRKVVMAVQVNTFHAITEKARQSIGGKHNLQFDYVMLDAETRQPLTTVQSLDASFKAYGGNRAYKAMRAGNTQKVRITNHVASAIQEALRTQ